MPTVRANGLDVHYTAEGNGPPLVMLHGASSSSIEDWSAQRPLFRKAFRLYLVDLRGHARTHGEVGGPVDGATLAADLLATVDALGLPTFHLAGFSLGGLTALQFAVDHPERLRTLVLVGVDPQREPRASVARVLMDPDRIERQEPAWAAQLERRHGPVQGPGAWRDLLRAIHDGIREERVLSPADLRRVRVPTLVVVGDRDVFVPVDHAVSLYRQLPEAQLCIVPDCGHQAMVLRPTLFGEVAERFYRTTEAVATERAMAARPAPRPGPGPRRAPMPGAILARPDPEPRLSSAILARPDPEPDTSSGGMP
jgi:pimeloyl-ACP methyl ester carboxylesterase